MKFQQYGRVNPDKMYKIKPMQLAENVILRRLNFLLGFVKEKNEELYKRYIVQLEKKIQSLVGDIDISEEKLGIKEKLSNYPHLNQHSKLTKIHYNFLIKLLEKPIEEVINSEEVLIPSKNYWLIVFGIRYYQAQALTEIMEKEKAIELFKEYIDQYGLSVKSTYKHYETLEEMRKDHIEESEQSTDIDFDVIISTVEDGRYIVRNNNCPAIDAMSDFEDKELVYVTCCHGDYQYAVLSNEHFVMTRDFTIAEDDPYCDKVFHDTRIDKKVKHPTKEFLDSMGPILKKNKS